MVPALAALLVLAPPPTHPVDSFRIGIRPRAGVVYRYRQLLEARATFAGHESSPLVRDIFQNLAVVRKSAAGFEILMDTASVKLSMPPEVPTNPVEVRRTEAAMKGKLVLGAILTPAGGLKQFVSYTAKPDPGLAKHMMSICFAFVACDIPGRKLRVGDAWAESIDPGTLLQGFKVPQASLAALKPLKVTWTLKSIETRGGRDVAVIESRLAGECHLSGEDATPPPVESFRVSSKATCLYDVKSAMLIRLDQTVEVDGEGRDKPGAKLMRFGNKSKVVTTLLNPGDL